MNGVYADADVEDATVWFGSRLQRRRRASVTSTRYEQLLQQNGTIESARAYEKVAPYHSDMVRISDATIALQTVCELVVHSRMLLSAVRSHLESPQIGLEGQWPSRSYVTFAIARRVCLGRVRFYG